MAETDTKYYVSGKFYRGFAVCQETNGKKYYLSKLTRNIENSSWTIDALYARYFSENKAKELVKEFQSLDKTDGQSLKEYRTMGFEGEVLDTLKAILESRDLDFGVDDVVLTYDNDGRAEITKEGNIYCNYITTLEYAWSSGYYPSNKDAYKLFNDLIEFDMQYARENLWDKHKDELIALGIKGEKDKKLNYHDLYDMGAVDLAEELDRYEMDYMSDDELYTEIYCTLEETDDGIEVTVYMDIEDEYSSALVKYKPVTVLVNEDMKDWRDILEDAVNEVAGQF